MRSFAVLALAGAVAALPATAPASPSGCSQNYDGKFQISVVNVTQSSKRSLNERADTALTVTLKDGVLTDAESRTGEIVANQQFQFDAILQPDAIYTSGWSVCSNGTLAIGDSAVFYQCLSGTFYNLYDESTGAQCTPIYIYVVPVGASSSASGVATQIGDGQVTASAAGAVTQISDGQIQATTATPVVTQISDGQIQATTGAAVVTQISDGQLQLPTGVVTQISDGQIQAGTSTGAVVTQISDGQIQAATSTGAVVTQISDGQLQAPTTIGPVVTQISDGQLQAPTATGAVVTQISDGQIQAATNGTTPTLASATPSVSVYTGGASSIKTGVFGLAAGVLAAAML